MIRTPLCFICWKVSLDEEGGKVSLAVVKEDDEAEDVPFEDGNKEMVLSVSDGLAREFEVGQLYRLLFEEK